MGNLSSMLCNEEGYAYRVTTEGRFDFLLESDFIKEKAF